MVYLPWWVVFPSLLDRGTTSAQTTSRRMSTVVSVYEIARNVDFFFHSEQEGEMIRVWRLGVVGGNAEDQ